MKRGSIWYMCTIISIAFLVLHLMLSVGFIYRTEKIVWQQASDSGEKAMSSYMDSFEDSLHNTELYLSNFLSGDRDVLSLSYSKDPNSRQLTKADIYDTLNSAALLHTRVDALFFSTRDKESTFIVAGTAQSNFSDVAPGLKNAVTGLISGGEPELYRWFPLEVDGSNYLVRILRSRDTYAGAWVSADSILQPIKKTMPNDDSALLLITPDGRVMNRNPAGLTQFDVSGQTGRKSNGVKYIQVDSKAETGSFSIVWLQPNLSVSRELSRMLLLLSLAAFVMLLVSTTLVQRFMMWPMRKMLNTMQRIKAGDLSSKVEMDTRFKEFSELADTFNEMMSETQQLNRSLYEKQLQAQEAQLKYLQLQAHPHFFLNSINLIYSMAKLGRCQEIQAMSLHLAEYLRYRFKNPLEMVPLSVEMDHVKNYLEIQKMRFVSRIEYTIAIDDNCLDASFLPLLVQSFVENSIKYATNEKSICIAIQCKRHGDRVCVTISDNGKGFPMGVIIESNSGQQNTNDARIGIENARQRLNLLYPDDHTIHFYNRNGAVVDIEIPYQPVAAEPGKYFMH